MPIPFHSIDFNTHEWKVFLKAACVPQGRNSFAETLLAERFFDELTLLLPSARLGFSLALDAFFSPGDEIIVSALSFPLYIHILIKKGLVPVFVDIAPENFCMASSQIEKCITPKTKGLLVTHLFGHPAQMDVISNLVQRHGLKLIEDCAQSYGSLFQGRATGSWGDAAIFSMSLTKVPTSLGGGVLTLKDSKIHAQIQKKLESLYRQDSSLKLTLKFPLDSLFLALSSPLFYTASLHFPLLAFSKLFPERFYQMAAWGQDNKMDFQENERPPLKDYQTQIALSQFERAQAMIEKKRANAKVMNEILERNSKIQVMKEGNEVCWNHQYAIATTPFEAKAVTLEMLKRGFCLIREDTNHCPSYPFAAPFSKPCPVADKLSKTLIRLPHSSFLTEKEATRIAKGFSQVIDSLK